MATWHDTTSVRAVWRDAPSGDVTLNDLLLSAREQIEAFAGPALLAEVAAANGAIPNRWRLAQQLQARAIWTAQLAGPGEQVGMDGLGVRVYPLDWQIQQLVYPKLAIPGIG